MTSQLTHLAKLFRPLEPKVMREWLVTVCPFLEDDALWDGKTRKEMRDRVLPVIRDQLNKVACRKLDATAERVLLLADRAGQEAWTYMRGKLVAQLGAAEVDAIEGGGNGYYRVLTLLRRDAKLFAEVEGVRYADEWRGGRLYSGFLVSRHKTPQAASPWKEQFETALDALLGANGEIVSEHFEQHQEQDDGEIRTLFHSHVVLKGLEDYYETMIGKEIVAGSIFPLNQIRIVYLSDEGLLEIYAHRRHLRPEIARLFAIHLLGESGDLELVPKRRYALERLRDSTPLPIDPADALRIEAIDVMEARFAAGNKGSDFTLKRGSQEPRTLYQMAAAQFAGRDPFKGLNPITRARIVIRFRKTGPNDSARKLPIVITMPDKCNIRHRSDSDQKLGDKYVRLWGLVVDEEPPDAIPVGLANTPAAA